MTYNRSQENLAQHQEFMRQIEKILYFVSALEIGVLSFAGLDQASGVLGIFSLVFLFYAYAFWYLFSHYVSSNIRYEEAYPHRKASEPIHFLLIEYKQKTDFSALGLILLVFGAFVFLICALLDHFILDEIFSSLPIVFSVVSVALSFVLLFGAWIILYLPLLKGPADYAVELKGL